LTDYRISKNKADNLHFKKIKLISCLIKAFVPAALITVFSVFTGCSVEPAKIQQPEQVRKKEPYIKIGIMETSSPVNFMINNRSLITSYDGSFIAKGLKKSVWQAQAKIISPPVILYLLVAGSMSSYENAEDMVVDLNKRGIPSFILPVKKKDVFSFEKDGNKKIFRVCLQKKFYSRQEAAEFQSGIENKIETFIVKYEAKKAEGKITLKNIRTGQIFESSNPVYIKGSSVKIFNVPVGKGFHWESSETRTYPEKISLQLDSSGRLVVINILPVEEYLKGVLPSEMPDTFPIEALKAQAVAARSEALAKIGHAHKQDPYDLCADVHCQVYSGLTKKSKHTDRAVKETRGLVLWNNHKICDAVYSAVCGGHTEDAKNVWGGQDTEYLKGKYDGPYFLKQKYGSLQNESNLRKWIDRSPPAFCNSTGSVPSSLNYTKKYFRWEKTVTQDELEKSVKKTTGQDIGMIKELEVLSRGVSGRIIQMRIWGTKGSVLLNRELKIRKALSGTTLWSSCFYVEPGYTVSGIPQTFKFKGAGFGHGVGMCQTGAAMMAIKGASFIQILNHYYQGSRLKRLY